MRLRTRLDALAQRPVTRMPQHARGVLDRARRKLCAGLEVYTPIPAGGMYADVEVRLDAALDRLYTAGVGIAARPHASRAGRIAAAYGMTLAAFREALQERAGR